MHFFKWMIACSPKKDIKRFWLCRWRKPQTMMGQAVWESQIKVDGQLRYVLVSAGVSLFGPLCSLYFQEAHEGEMLSSRWVSPGRNVSKTRINQSLIFISFEWLKTSIKFIFAASFDIYTLTANNVPCISHACHVILDISDHKHIWKVEVLQTYRHLLFFETLFAECRFL